MEHNIGYAVIKTCFFCFRASWIKTLAYENWKYTPPKKKDSIIHQPGFHALSHWIVFLNKGAPLKKKDNKQPQLVIQIVTQLDPRIVGGPDESHWKGYQLPALEVFFDGWATYPTLPVTY